MSSEFIPIISVVAFLAIIWFSGRLCKFINLSPLIGWIFAGIMCGPKALHLIKENNQEVWILLGSLGVTLLIAESGTHIHFDKIKKVGLSAVFVALIGTFLPVLLGLSLVLAFGIGDYKAAFAVGCICAPTSVGVALKLLSEANQLNSLPGQTIVTAAFLDDVFSIILLVVLQSIKEENANTYSIIFNIITKFLWCFLFLAIGTLLAMYVFGQFTPKLLHSIPSYENRNYQPRDEIHLLIMIIILISYSFIGNLVGSHLLGAFIAGISFSQVSRSMYVWRRQMKRLIHWLIRLFFACSVAFTIPTKELLSLPAFGYGVVFALVPGVIGKVLSGFISKSKSNRWIIGFAMVGRGEFAYFVAQSSQKWELISPDLYAIIVWALLIAVVVAPIAFQYVLKISFKQEIKSGIKWFTIKAEAEHHTGVHFEVVDVLHNLKLDILEAKVETDGDTDCSEFIVGVSGNDNLDIDKMHEILHDIREAVGPKAQIQLLPIDEQDMMNNTSYRQIMSNANDDYNNNDDETNQTKSSIQYHYNPEDTMSEMSENAIEYLLEIKLMSSHSPKIFHLIIEEMESNSIQLLRGNMEDFLNTDSLIIFGKMTTNIDVRDIKKKLKNVLKLNHINGEILCKKINANLAVIPHHVKFSDLLRCSTSNNPLLSNKIQNGYEIDVCCEPYIKHLILSISNIFESLNLDIRTIHVEIIENQQDKDRKHQKLSSTFFVQQSSDNNIDSDAQRNEIECYIAKIFQKENVAATIKTKRIEMGKPRLSTDANNIHQTIVNSVNQRNETLTIDIPDDNGKGDKNGDDEEIADSTTNTLAAITESVVIVTPKRTSTLPSVEKGELKFSFIGLPPLSRQGSMQSCPPKIELYKLTKDENDKSGDDEDSNDTNISHHSSCSILDVLNGQ